MFILNEGKGDRGREREGERRVYNVYIQRWCERMVYNKGIERYMVIKGEGLIEGWYIELKYMGESEYYMMENRRV